MGTGLETVAVAAGQLAEVERIESRLAEYLEAGTASSTRRAYAGDFARFAAWCETFNAAPLPAAPAIVARYLVDSAETHKPATVTRQASAIAWAHTAAGHESPTRTDAVRETLRCIRRKDGTAPDAKAPLTVADVRAITAGHLPAGVKGARDRALLLVGFAGGLRRSELVGIDVEHVAFVGEGVVITLPRSKTDQDGAGRPVAIPFGTHKDTCPVRALQTWIAAAGIEAGPVFRPVNRHGQIGSDRLTGRAVALVVKHYAAALGRDADDFAGHSLRAGFATAAARGGASERDIMRQTGHKSAAMVRRYIRDGNLFRANAAGALGL